MAARQRPRPRRRPPPTAPPSMPPAPHCRRPAHVCWQARGRSAAALVVACAADALARDRVGPRPRTSIHVLLIAPGLFHIGYERGVVGREDAEDIADGVVDAACRQVELNMPGLLRGARLVEARA